MKREILDFLDIPVWPQTLEADVEYTRQHDDTDGGNEGHLIVQFSVDGDAWVSIDGKQSLRFRNWGGGGRSLKTHAALLILAEAIRQDNLKDKKGSI